MEATGNPEGLRTAAAMAVIFEPHGPLSFPCENTTVRKDRGMLIRQAARQPLDPFEFRRAVLLDVQAVQADRHDFAARRRMHDAKSMQAGCTLGRETDHQVKCAALVAYDEKRVLHPAVAERPCVMQRLEEGAHLG